MKSPSLISYLPPSSSFSGKDGKANKVDLDLGEPMPGGKLPTEILIDDTLTAEIAWEGDTNDNGIADVGETLTYRQRPWQWRSRRCSR